MFSLAKEPGKWQLTKRVTTLLQSKSTEIREAQPHPDQQSRMGGEAAMR